MPATDKMLATREGAIGWITFNNPARRNAVSLAMWQALGEIVRGYAQDPSVRAIVLRGAGEQAFVSGADISEFEEKRSSEEAIAAYNRAGEEASAALEQAGKPTLAMIRGYCIGGGVSIALCCDLRFAAEGAKFGVPAARLGLGYGFEGVRRLVGVVGPSYAKEIFYTARHFSAREALAMGLVNRVVADTELEAAVRLCAATIAENAPLTLGSIKLLVGEAMKDPQARDLGRCQDSVRRCFASEDYVEGRRAFMEKRKPRFQGR
jgi:enoyl-CoA hydratase